MALSVLCGCITNHCEFSCLKQHSFIISQFCRAEAEVWLRWVLYSVFLIQSIGWSECSSETPPWQFSLSSSFGLSVEFISCGYMTEALVFLLASLLALRDSLRSLPCGALQLQASNEESAKTLLFFLKSTDLGL